MVRDTSFVFPRLESEYMTSFEVCCSQTEKVIFGWFLADFLLMFYKKGSILDTENGKRYKFRFYTVRLRIYDFYWGMLLPDQNYDFWLIYGWFLANFYKNGSILDSENGKRYEFRFSTVRLRIYDFYWGMLLPVHISDFWLISGWCFANVCKNGAILDTDTNFVLPRLGSEYMTLMRSVVPRLKKWKELLISIKFPVDWYIR